MEENIFDGFLQVNSLFSDKEVLRHTHMPAKLPHRDTEVEAIMFNLVEALKGNVPSNMIIYGPSGAGKTAVINFICRQLEKKGRQIDRYVNPVYVNCRKIDTQYRVLAHLGNSLLEEYEQEDIPFTGWPTDRVFSELVKRMNLKGGVHVLVLDEIDHLVKKSGDDLLYNLTNLNAELDQARCSIIGISNDLKFTGYLDSRVRSRLGQEDLVFKPYNALQLQDILAERAADGILADVLSEAVIRLCSALAAQEHGDARRALNLLRVSTEKAEQCGETVVLERHVRMAQNQIECDQFTPAIAALPSQQKLVLFSILQIEQQGLRNIATGEIYEIYKQACKHFGNNILTQRRLTTLLSELDTLGIVTAKTISRGRYGRTKQVNSCIPNSIDAVKIMIDADELMQAVGDGNYRLQTRL
ncbi:MAG TPA: AAA family ATPase [Candidatus Poseidoniales archaeon]|nr:MAG: cell division control protein Cdc6 [Euryarchaeota archaeon]HIA40410.1 AAA family ATPase [Candidatus Poseidoniales archaeon]HIA89692.1 AAA family ATPase [Candidatus Poseidoniales archaeon]HIB59927.1 AAA family ATPase [Candidatus Poseidoniales archaeon]HIO94599.1 AAA family ATPase [Candidatus Poseidoniales archaeon]